MTDDQLLERLGHALIPIVAPSAPPTSSVVELHRMIDAPRSRLRTPAARSRFRVLPITIAAAVAASIALVVVATSLPRDGRETATRITVTATSPALGEVTERRRVLEAALADGDVAAVSSESARLRLALTALAASEWAPIRADIEELLERADALLQRRRAGNDEVPGVAQTVTSTVTPTTQPAAVPVLPVATQPPTSVGRQAASPPPTVTAPTGATSPAEVAPDGGDDNSGPGGGGPDDDNSGPGGGGSGDDSSGPGGGGGSGSGGD
jgi:uncharacterized membrane protein YgcG